MLTFNEKKIIIDNELNNNEIGIKGTCTNEQNFECLGQILTLQAEEINLIKRHISLK